MAILDRPAAGACPRRPSSLYSEQPRSSPHRGDGRVLVVKLRVLHVGARLRRAVNAFDPCEKSDAVGDEVMPAATLDRLLPRCHVANIKGSSYRVREFKASYRGYADGMGEAASGASP